MSLSASPTCQDQSSAGAALMPSGRTEGSMSLSDGMLLQRIAVKDRQAFEVLYKRHYHRLLHFVRRKVRSEGMAEEVVSDTMFVLWQNAGSFQGASSVLTWLFGIAHRQALRTLERNRKHSIVDSNDELIADAPDASPGTNPESIAIADSDGKLLARGLAMLSEHHRVVVELTATGHSSGEIAEIVGCLENTVRTRMFHARQHLRRFLARAARDSEMAESRFHLTGGPRTLPSAPVQIAPPKAAARAREDRLKLSEWLENVCTLTLATEEL